MPSNLSFSRMNLSWTSLSSSSRSLSTLLESCYLSILLILLIVTLRTSSISLGFLILISFVPFLKNFKNSGSLIFIFIFYFGVRSPWRKTATTERNSQFFSFDTEVRFWNGLNGLDYSPLYWDDESSSFGFTSVLFNFLKIILRSCMAQSS